MHSDHNLRCDAAICRWQRGSVGLYGTDGACMCAVILLHSCRLFHHSLSLVVPWPEAPFSPPSTLSHRERDPPLFSCRIPKCFTVLSLSLCSLPSLFCSSEKQWFMNCNIYHKTVLLHAYSYMIHLQVLLGPHRRRMPICLGKEKVKLWAQKNTTWSKKRGIKSSICTFLSCAVNLIMEGKVK